MTAKFLTLGAAQARLEAVRLELANLAGEARETVRAAQSRGAHNAALAVQMLANDCLRLAREVETIIPGRAPGTH